MLKKKKTNKTAAVRELLKSPMLPSTSIVISGKVYRMCFDLQALAEAEHEFNEQGHEVNLLNALPTMNLENTRIVFAASIRKFHPEIGFKEALALLTLPYVYPAALKIADAWRASLAEPSKDEKGSGSADPTPAS